MNYDGVLCVDKPRGWTSTQAVERARRAFGVRVGHCGTLDPAATGLLVVAVGRATRLVPYLETGHKLYRASVCLGVATDTLDAEGRVVATRPVPPLAQAAVEETLCHFQGEIEQVPPMFSALRHRGQRLYRLARRGLEVPRAPRRVMVNSIRLLALEDERLELEVACGPGTYIRSLAADISRALGTVGHLWSLCRLESDGFCLKQAIDISQAGDDELQRALLPLEKVLSRFHRLELRAERFRRLAAGNVIALEEADLPAGSEAPVPGTFVWAPGSDCHALARVQVAEDEKISLRPVKVIKRQ